MKIIPLLALFLFLGGTARAQGLEEDIVSFSQGTGKYELLMNAYVESYSFANDTTKGESVSFVYRDLDKLTLFAEETYQSKFGRDEKLFKGGGAYRINDKFIVQEILAYSGDKWTFPSYSTDTQVVYLPVNYIAAQAGYKYLKFSDANVDIYILGATYYPIIEFYINVQLMHSISDFDNGARNVPNNSYLAKAGFTPDADNELIALYSKNSESFMSVDRIGEFEADTYGANWKSRLLGNWWMSLSFTYQRRIHPVEGAQRTFEAGAIYRW
ncbi:MAG: YaiO family outer membrane beta-barrel protein [Nitrospinae bacterium]|nr:YaiO family outer membrane beta-barrel protein [Nitrospinota bacterium]